MSDGDVTGNLRFAITPEVRRDITLILKPYVGFALNHTDLDYVQYLADRGVNVSEKDAHAFAVTVMREKIYFSGYILHKKQGAVLLTPCLLFFLCHRYFERFYVIRFWQF